MDIEVILDMKIFHKSTMMIKNTGTTIMNYNIKREKIQNMKIFDAFVEIVKLLKINKEDIIFSTVNYVNESIFKSDYIITENTKKLSFSITSTADEKVIENNANNFNEKKYLNILKNKDKIIKSSLTRIIEGKFDYEGFVKKYPSGGYIFIVGMIDFIIDIQSYKNFIGIITDINVIDKKMTEMLLNKIVNENKLLLLYEIANSDFIKQVKLNDQLINILITSDIKNKQYLIDYLVKTKNTQGLFTLLYFSIKDSQEILDKLKTMNLNDYYRNIVSELS